ncbi:hypothetical protein EV175_001980 [Coemansia sp. RSA 1933]|nr:hypothetical protein EV175_001980 [Coemansia sp. RSA 1933]
MVGQMTGELRADEPRGDNRDCAIVTPVAFDSHGAVALGMAIDASGKRIRISGTRFADAAASNGHELESTATQVFIPSANAVSSVSDFFEFVAYCIREFIHKHELVDGEDGCIEGAVIPLGVSIGLPVSRQRNPQSLKQNERCPPLSCTIAEVSKEDSLDLGNRDVARHLHDAILRNYLPVRITSVTNNVVSSLIAAKFSNKDTCVAASFNHGVNAAYVKRQCNNGQDTCSEFEVVNTEIGRFGSESGTSSSSVLPMTMWDNRIDRESRNPGARRFEKLVADQYLGEIVRNLITDFMDQQQLFSVNCDVSKINESYSFHTAYMAPIMEDTSGDLASVGDLFDTVFGISTDLSDRQIIRALCDCVASRASRLSGAALAALVSGTRPVSPCTVALSGVLLNSKPIFNATMATMHKQLSNDKATEVYIQPRYSELLGAALSAVRS